MVECLEKFSLNFSISLSVILVPLWFIIIFSVFFCLQFNKDPLILHFYKHFRLVALHDVVLFFSCIEELLLLRQIRDFVTWMILTGSIVSVKHVPR